MKTQTTCKPRLNNDTLGDDALKSLYRNYEIMHTSEFAEFCMDTVNAGGGARPVKDKIVSCIFNANNKTVMLKKTQDFILAGMGLGV